MIKISKREKFVLLGLLLILNIILRFQVVNNELFNDSFLMHIIVNSLNEFGYARWFLHPLSIAGLYPASYTSSMHFLLSGIAQCTSMEMRWTIFLYCLFIGLLSMSTAYLMAGEILDNDLFKFLVAFGFSTTPCILGYTTWTIPTRGLFVVLAPLLIYVLLKCLTSFKYVPLVVIFAIFLFVTHHLFYFLIPAFLALIILLICFKLKTHVSIRIPEPLMPIIILGGFLCMFLIPFFTGRFIEESRYAPIGINYVRYMGVLIIFTISGLTYQIFKRAKGFRELFLLLTLILLTTFIYEQTYMKWFLPIFLIPFAGIGLLNVLRESEKRKYILPIVVIFLLLASSFSAYYQFLHTYEKTSSNERYMEESTYMTGRWMKDNINGTAISNDEWFGDRIFAASDTTRFLIPAGMINLIYGFISIDISKFERYPITEEDFWFTGYKGPAIGAIEWGSVHMLRRSPKDFNITCLVENMRCKGRVHWRYTLKLVELLNLAHEKDCIYDCGDIKIWGL